MAVVFMLNHYNSLQNPKTEPPPIKLGEFLTFSPPDQCLSFTVVLKHSPDFLKNHGPLENSTFHWSFSIKPVHIHVNDENYLVER